VNGAHILRADVPLKRFDRRIQAFPFAQVVSGRKGVGCVEADAQVKRLTIRHDLAQVFEAMAYTFALPGRVFEQDAKRAQVNAVAGRLYTLGADAYRVCLARAPGAARMNDQVISAERDAAQDLFAERGA
jgi:hypothetical protein